MGVLAGWLHPCPQHPVVVFLASKGHSRTTLLQDYTLCFQFLSYLPKNSSPNLSNCGACSVLLTAGTLDAPQPTVNSVVKVLLGGLLLVASTM